MNNSRDYYGFKEVFDLFDNIFNDVGFQRVNVQPMRYNKHISTSQFPPANVILNRESKELYIEVALAGCTEDNINLSFDSDHLKLVVDVPTKVNDDKEDPNVYIQRGLKKIQHVETAWFVDPRFYDRDSCKHEFLNGLLTIRIFPREDVRPKKIHLFGKYEEKKELEDKKEE